MTKHILFLNKLKSLIEENWQSPPLPEVSPVWKKRTVGFIDDRRDQILLSPRQENVTYFGLFGSDHLHEITLDMDIRTYQDIERHSDIVTEVMRIIKDKIRGSTEYVDVRILNSVSRNERVRNMFNHIITIDFRVINP